MLLYYITLACFFLVLVTDISRKIMRGIALALDAPIDVFEGDCAGDPFWVCRLIGYPVSADIPESERTDTGWYNPLSLSFR
jgi:isopenicillin N synthase-like dioxygenase